MDLKISVLLIMAVAIIYIGMINFFTILFRITGLTKEKARFQVISMLTNSGFTTGESELITTNKVRRRLCLACMITGNIFSVVIVSLFVNALFSLSHQQAEGAYQMIFYAFLIFVAILIIFKIPFVKNPLEKLIEKCGTTLLTKNNKDNVLTVLDNYGDNAMAEIVVNSIPEMLDGTTLEDSKIKLLFDINILTIKRNENVVEITRDTIIEVNDIITVFGSYKSIKKLFLNIE